MKRNVFLLQYLERCSRFEKIVDARLKEMRLMQANIHENSAMDRSAFISKKKGNNQEKNKNNVLIKGKGEHPKKKSRMKRLEKDDTFFKELADSEAAFFQTVKKVKKNLSSREEGAIRRCTYHWHKIFSCAIQDVYFCVFRNIKDRCYEYFHS